MKSPLNTFDLLRTLLPVKWGGSADRSASAHGSAPLRSRWALSASPPSGCSLGFRASAALVGVACLLSTTTASLQASVELAVSQSQSVLFSLVDWTNSVPFNKFDTSLGTLKKVRVTVTDFADGSAQTENFDLYAPVTVSVAIGATVTVRRPDGSAIVGVTAQKILTWPLTAFDGVFEFQGDSGHTVVAGTEFFSSASRTTNSVAPSSDLTLFAGPGTLALTVEAIEASTASGGAELRKILRTSSAAAVELEYIYEPRDSFVGDIVWNDLNGDGAIDGGEPGIGGAVVTLLNGTGAPVAGVLPQVTDWTGAYLFRDVPAGNYRVHVYPPPVYFPNYDLDGTNTANEASFTVIAGEDKLDVDFGYTVPVSTDFGSIGDRVWYDNDGDGLQGPGEPGIAGVSVVLRDESLVDLAEQVTDANGFYIFTNLPSALYNVVVLNPPVAGFPTTDYDGTLTPNEVAIALNPGENQLEIDFGYQTYDASIGGVVWNDRDRDGVQDPGEAGIPGVVVHIYSSADPLSEIASWTTDANGNYAFESLFAGVYLVKTDLPGGYAPTYDLDGLGTPNCTQIVLGAAQARTHIDFGYDRASLGDRIWNDANGNGLQDGGELGIPGAVVELFIGGISLGVTTSDATGFYTFGDLPPDTYRVEVTVSGTGFVPTYDIDGLGSTNQATVNLAAGQDRMDVDFGYKERGEDIGNQGGGLGLGDRVWSDVNGNGLQDGGEAGLEGITVQVFNALNSLVGTEVTDLNGHYMFTNLPAGTYTVSAGQPVGYVPTFDLDGLLVPAPSSSVVTLVSGVTRTDVDFGYQQLASIGDLVWNDLNGNGTPEVGEPGLSGVSVTASGPGGTYTAITAPNGQYSLTGIVAGTYTVSAGGPPGYDATYDFDGTNTPSVSVVVLAAGAARTEVDFGYRQTQNAGPQGRIGDLVWLDRNGNGVQDGGEPGLANVTVTLEDLIGGGTPSIATDANGRYLFKNLTESTSLVTLTPPAGHIAVYDLDGVIDSPDRVLVELGTGEHHLDVDFGYQELPGSIGDLVWLDTNENGIEDGVESGLGGVTVTLLQGSTTLATTVTAANGTYRFNSVFSGTYTLTVTAPLNHAAVFDQDGVGTPGTTVVVMGINQNRSDIDFGYQSIIGSIGDLVWSDANGDGLYNNGESGLSGVTVELRQGASVISTKVTGLNGTYGFSNLLAGSYTVNVQPPAHHVPTFDADGIGSPGVAGVILNAGENRSDVDFGYKYVPPIGSVGDRIWQDLNGNGMQETGEPGLSGVTLTISQTSVTLATTVSGSGGEYLFPNLYVGNYVVSVMPPEYYRETFDPDGLSTTNRVTFSLAAGENRRDVDFGYLYDPPPGSIGDRVWEDTNGDGLLNGTETGLVGVTVVLYNASNIAQATNVTSAGGYYTFNGLGAGKYTIRVTPPADYYNPTYDFDGIATANQATLTLGIGQDRTDVDFGFIYSPILSSIGDRVWIDEDGDGNQDAGELGLAFATVTLRDGATHIVATAITGPNGSYSFGNLWPGTYTVTVTVPANLAATYDYDGVFTPGVTAVTLGFATDLTNIDFGYRLRTDLASIGDRLWSDANWNAAQDPAEAGLVGVTVILKDAANVIVGSTKTGANGIYAFSNLLAGTYSIAVQRPAGYTKTYDVDGLSTLDKATVTVVAAQNRRDVDFGYANNTSPPPPGRGCSISYWLSNDGQTLLTQTDFSTLSALSLRKSDGSARDFTGSLSANKSSLIAWLGDHTAINMAFQVSLQFAAFQLDVIHGFYQPASIIPTPSCNADGFMTASQFIAAIDAQLSQDGYTPAGDPNRAAQECLKTALDAINNSCTPTPTPFEYPEGGEFIIGDRVNIALNARVNFWGPQWEQNNPMSGMSGGQKIPSAFKGFENDVTTPTCGSAWTSRPGNSSNPPSTVPKFMGVIVSSLVVKNGSVISGTTRKIVVVEVEPGYGPAPGHKGWGRVVATFCSPLGTGCGNNATR